MFHRFWYHKDVAKRSFVTTGVQFFRHVVPQVAKPIHSLWNQMIGFLFILLALMAASAVFRICRHYDGSPESLFRLILSCFFFAIMALYGIASLLRARKISRS